DRLQELVLLHRLHEISGHAQLAPARDVSGPVLGGEHQDADAGQRRTPVDLFGDLESIDPGHAAVEEDQTVRNAGDLRLYELLERQLATGDLRHARAPPGERLAEDQPVRRVVVDDERLQ